MKKVKVISYKNLPAKFPISSTALTYLLLDKFNAPGWVWGVFGTLFVILWIVSIIYKVNQEQVEIGDPKNPDQRFNYSLYDKPDF